MVLPFEIRFNPGSKNDNEFFLALMVTTGDEKLIAPGDWKD